MDRLELYSYYRSSCSYRVRIVLNWKALAYDYKPVHLVRDGGEQLKSSYQSQNPSGEVPYLVHNGFGLSQSMAISEYLEERFPEPALLPKAPEDRARVRQLCEVINSGIQPIQNLKVLKFVQSQWDLSNQDKAEWARYWIDRGFHALEKFLTQTSQLYCFGEQVTLADAFLIPQVYNAQRFQVEIKKFPKIAEINERCLQNDAFIKAHPDQQPDASL